MHSGRVLGLDYGTKNIGLAICDELGTIVSPLPSIPYKGRRDLLQRIQSAIREQQATAIVVGLPVNMDGSLGEAALRARKFMAILREETVIPVMEFDERLSSVEAGEIWREMTARRQRKYRTVDSLAAALILERFLRES
jgi:putative Holliday junction resolvase